MKKLRICAVSLLLILLCVSLALPCVGAATARPVLVVGGMPFGVRFAMAGVLVAGYSDVKSGGAYHNPAREAGLLPGDCLYQIGENPLSDAASLAKSLQESKGGKITLHYRRGEEEKTVTLAPLRADEDGRWRVGLSVRDSGAGIGTITFIDEQASSFAGLGHGICDGESGALMPLSRGAVMDVQIEDIARGAVGAPGELRGKFLNRRLGALTGNTTCGVFGKLCECPASPAGKCEIAYRNEVKEGEATLWCTTGEGGPRAYSVSLSAIKRAEKGNKCFTVKVTDEALLAKTGGIVQGMSGSPILQGGRLVGAITHVLVGDPTTGYGIFIENMLENAPKAA